MTTLFLTSVVAVFLLSSRMSKSALTTFRFAEHIYFCQFGLLCAGNYHLRNAFTRFYGLCFLTEINKDNAYFTAVVGINRAGAVQHSQSAFQAS